MHLPSFCYKFASLQHTSLLNVRTCHNRPEKQYNKYNKGFQIKFYFTIFFVDEKNTFLSSELNDFQVVASCRVSSCLLGSGSPASLSMTLGLCSWQNWKNGFAGRFGAFGSAFAPFLFVPFFGFSSFVLFTLDFEFFSCFVATWQRLFSSKTPIGISLHLSPCWSNRLIKNLQ